MASDLIIDKYVKRIMADYPEQDKIYIDLKQFANELLEEKLSLLFLAPTDTDINEEAEGRYPVETHSSPTQSPYVGSKKTFIHGAEWAISFLRKKIGE